MQIVAILGEYQLPKPGDIEVLMQTNRIFMDISEFYKNLQQKEIAPEELSTNELERVLRELEGLPNFKALYEGLAKILSNAVLVDNYGLPYSLIRVKCNNELLLFVMKIIRTNPVSSIVMVVFYYLCAAEGRSERHFGSAFVST